MKLLITAEEIQDRCIWEEFCEMRGINEWAVNEGLMDSDEQFVLTVKEAKTLGISFP